MSEEIIELNRKEAQQIWNTLKKLEKLEKIEWMVEGDVDSIEYSAKCSTSYKGKKYSIVKFSLEHGIHDTTWVAYYYLRVIDGRHMYKYEWYNHDSFMDELKDKFHEVKKREHRKQAQAREAEYRKQKEHEAREKRKLLKDIKLR